MSLGMKTTKGKYTVLRHILHQVKEQLNINKREAISVLLKERACF